MILDAQAQVRTAAGFSVGNTNVALSNSVQVTVANETPQTSVMLSKGRTSGSNIKPAFTINFGQRVREVNPQALFNLTGADR